MSKNVELSEYITFIKNEVKKSEDPRPKEGFWIGVQTIEITCQTITEIDKKGVLRLLLLTAEGEKRERMVQTVKINMATQEFKKPSGRVG